MTKAPKLTESQFNKDKALILKVLEHLKASFYGLPIQATKWNATVYVARTIVNYIEMDRRYAGGRKQTTAHLFWKISWKVLLPYNVDNKKNYMSIRISELITTVETFTFKDYNPRI